MENVGRFLLSCGDLRGGEFSYMNCARRAVMAIWRRADSLSLICGLAVIVLPLLVFWPVTLGRQTWRGGDLSAFSYPLSVISSRQWLQGRLPLWNRYSFGGIPLAAAQQASVFYPLNILLWLILPPWIVMGFSILIHLSLAGLSVFLFIRSLRLHPMAALFGGVAFQMGGFAMSHLGHVMILRALPWIGFSLQGFTLWATTGKKRYLAIVSLSVGQLALSGHPQTILYSLILVSTYFLLARRTRARVIVLGLLALGLGIGLSAIQLIPGVYMLFTNEYSSIDQISCSFHPAYLATFIFPRIRGGTYAEMVGYIGIAPLLLCLLGPFFRQSEENTRVRRFFIIWAIVALLLSVGHFIPFLSNWLSLVPVYGRVSRVPSRHLLELGFSITVLTAFGLDGVLHRSRFINLRWSIVLALVLVLGGWVLFAFLAPFGSETPPLNWEASFRNVGQPIFLLLLSTILLLAIWYVPRNSRYRQVLICSLLLLGIADVADFGSQIYARALTSSSYYRTLPATVDALRRLSPENPFRIISLGATRDDRELLASNHHAVYDIESLTGYDALMLHQFESGFDGVILTWGYVDPCAVEQAQFRALLDLYGVKYLLVNSEDAECLDRYYTWVETLGSVDIYYNEGARERLFLAGYVQDLQTFGKALSMTGYSLQDVRPSDSSSPEYVLFTQWYCEHPIVEGYTLYVHYVDDSGATGAQDDHLLGRRFTGEVVPTNHWTCPGYYRDVSYVPSELVEGGELRVALGLWIPETGERLVPSGGLPIDQLGRTCLEVGELDQVKPVADVALTDEGERMWIDSQDLSASSETVRLLHYEGDRIEADVAFDRDGLLVHGTNYVSGWRATVDGVPVPVFRVADVLQGIIVPQGRHQVEFRYRPDSFRWGAAISMASLGMTLGLFLWPQRRRPVLK